MFTDQSGSAAAKRSCTQTYVSDFHCDDNSNVSTEGNVRITEPGSSLAGADVQMSSSNSAGSIQQPGIAQRSVSASSLTPGQASALIEQSAKPGLVAHDYFAIGFHCGLPAEDLLDLKSPELEQEAACLKKALTACGSSLTVNALKKALRSPLVLYREADGYDALVSAWAAEHGVDSDNSLSDDQHQAFIDFLVSFPVLQRKWDFLALALGIYSDQLEVIKADEEQGLSTFQRLRDVLELASSKNIDALIKILGKNPAFPWYRCDLVKKITEWADSLGLKDQAFSQLSKEQLDQLLLLLRPVSPFWSDIGLGLGVKFAVCEALAEKFTTRLDNKEKFMLMLERAGSRGLLTGRNLVDAVHELYPAASSRLAQQLEIEPAKKDSACDHWQTLLNDHRQQRALTPSSLYRLFAGNLASEPVQLMVESVQGYPCGGSHEERFMVYLLTASRNNALSLPQVTDWLVSICRHRLPQEAKEFAKQNQQPEAESKPLEVQDIVSLLTSSWKGTIETALKVAALLGVSLDWNIISRQSHNSQPAMIWKGVLAALPGLQTGHLKQLFSRFHEFQELQEFHELQEWQEFHELQELQEFQKFHSLLPVKGEPTVALKGVSIHAHNIFELACQLQDNPELLIEATKKLLAPATMPRWLSSLSSCLPPLYLLLILVSKDSQSRKQLNAIIDSYVMKVSGKAKADQGEIPRLPDIGEYLPDHFMCPLSLMPMREPVPVRMNSGKDVVRYFEKSMLLRALSESAVNPLTREPLAVETVRNTPVDTTFRGQIVQWLSEHPNYQGI